MKKIDIARALRDEDYRSSLSAEEQASLPSPAGNVNLDDKALLSITGGCAWTTPATSCVPPGTYCP